MIDKILRCATCKKPAVADYKPFCSKRCQMVDLGHWLSDQYSIPGTQDTEDKPDDNI